MKIAIDGYEANAENRVGIGQYAYNILSNLYDLLEKRRDVSVEVYVPDVPLTDMPAEHETWKYRVLRPKPLWTFLSLPLTLQFSSFRPDVVFSPTHYIPRFIQIPRVMSLMDMSFLMYQDLFRKQDLHKLIHWTEYSVHHSSHIMTISEFTKNAIMQAYSTPSTKITVSYPGLSMKRNAKHTSADVLNKYTLRQQYILSVGTIQPRKNYARLIEAFSIFLKQNKQGFENTELVIVGKTGWLYEEILQTPKKFGLEKRVRFLQFVPDEDLVELYEHALMFVMPSLYEGFGLPVLEAMAHEAPVVVSRVSSLPEIAGDAAVYVDPEHASSIAEGLITSAKQRNTQAGKKRIQAGLKQVKKFSWRKAARQTLSVLEQVGEGKNV